MVNNGKLGGKRSKVTTTLGHELLRHETDTSDMEDFSILQPRKRPNKKGGASRLCATCFPLCLFLLVTACMAASGTLVWLHLGLREDMDRFRVHLQKVEAENEETPETLHSIHSHLKSLHTDITFLENKFVKVTSDVASVTQEVDRLRQIANNLEASIAAAPEIQSLPKNVEYLTESVANIGSKITALETTTKDMKTDCFGLKTSTDNLNHQMDVVKAKLDEVKAKQQLAGADAKLEESGFNQDVLSHFRQEMGRLSATVDSMNKTFTMKLIELNNLPLWFEAINRSVLWAVEDLHQHQTKINNIQSYIYDNLTSRLENQETKWDESETTTRPSQLQVVLLHRLVNQTVNQAIGSLVEDSLRTTKRSSNESWKDTLTDIHRLVSLYVDIVHQLNSTAEYRPEQLLNATLTEALIQQGNKLEALNSSTAKLRNQFVILESLVRKVDSRLEDHQYTNISAEATTKLPILKPHSSDHTARDNYSTPGSFPKP